jgi:hypothetical protein
MISFQYLFACLRLKRGEAQLFMFILPDNEIDHPVAKIANAIEQYDRVGGHC